ncbi:MAG: hypothetical protein OJF49_001600 [Ktedonobacterales bacterium]|nr:MAG: hypothetical protein OJF49_001600 [Ktedonobacterales bacterium]
MPDISLISVYGLDYAWMKLGLKAYGGVALVEGNGVSPCATRQNPSTSS